MICQSVQLNNFRNIETASVEFSDGINVLWGKNAQGKSNLLESIYFFARGKSFRGAKDKELIRFGCESATLSVNYQLEGHDHPSTLRAVLPQVGRRKITRDTVPTTTAEMIGSFRAVLFCPAHLSIVSGAPALRRNYLDIALSQLYPAYLDALTRYMRFLQERNSLLKLVAQGSPVSPSEWETYAEGLAHYGADIAYYRIRFLRKAEEHLKTIFREMTDGAEAPALQYQSHALPEGLAAVKEETFTGQADFLAFAKQSLYQRLMTEIERDVRAGSTLHGIHKDDFILSINGEEARCYASQGQQRSLALALKLAEGDISTEVTGEKPIILLDDVLSELDQQRRDYILHALQGKQIIVTSCEPALFSEIGSAVSLFHVSGGTLQPFHR